MTVNEKFLNKAESARYIGISARMIDILRSRGELAWVSIGTRVLFAKDELDRFMQANTHGTTIAINGQSGSAQCAL